MTPILSLSFDRKWKVPLMITASSSNNPLDRLSEKHSEAQEAKLPWNDVWQVFLDDPWFNHRLNESAVYLTRRCNLPFQYKDDVKQEALLHFARSVERDVSLGFRPERGSLGAFLATIINRCCQKGLRQFRNSQQSVLNESQHPLIENWDEFDEKLDLREHVVRIPDPYRTTIRLICEGQTIAEIASSKKKSERTVYRWLEKGIELLREQMEK